MCLTLRTRKVDFLSHFLISEGLQTFSHMEKEVATRIDKVPINDTFLQHFQDSIATATSSAHSDHNPIIIKLHTQGAQKKGIPFRYVNNWHMVEGYEDQVAHALSD